MKIAPASSAPRRRTAANSPSTLHRRMYAATHSPDFRRMADAPRAPERRRPFGQDAQTFRERSDAAPIARTLCGRGAPRKSVERAAGGGRELAPEPRGHLSGRRQVVIFFESLDRRAGCIVVNTGRLDRSITVLV